MCGGTSYFYGQLKFAGPMVQWRARSSVWVFGPSIQSPQTPPAGHLGRTCAPPMRGMELRAVHFSIILSLRFWAQFWNCVCCVFGLVLGSFRPPFGSPNRAKLDPKCVLNRYFAKKLIFTRTYFLHCFFRCF